MALYAEIRAIYAVSEAPAGTRVDVQVQIKNLFTSPITIMGRGALEYGVSPWPSITFPNNTATVNAGSTVSFAGYFTMPSYPPGKEIKIHAYSYWYGTDDMYHFDDEEVKTVKVGGADYVFSIGVPTVNLA